MPFPKKIKEEALLRSGRRCCLCLKYKGVKIEVHHIIPESISQDNSLNNAITLCFDCHAEVGHYNPSHPKGNKLTPTELKKHRDRLWKLIAEGKILSEKNLDVQYLELIRKAFDRPAFNTPFRQEGSMENFDKAIGDTILAINTGVLRTRDNQIIQDIGFGKSSLLNDAWKSTLIEIEVNLQDLLALINKGIAKGKIKTCHPFCYCGDDDFLNKIDNERVKIIYLLNSILIDAGIEPLKNTLKDRLK